MNYYNEIYFILFGFMFAMLAVSTAPYYRKNAIEKPSAWLAGVPFVAAASCVLFLLVPLTPKVVTNLANLLFIASMVGIGLLLRHWRKADSRQLIKVLSALGVATALGFQYLLAHGNFQHRVALVESWIIASAIWIGMEAYRLYRIRKSFYVLALMVISAAWIAINVARLADVLSSAPTNINLYQVPVSLMIFRFVMGALQTLGLIFLIAHASERLTWRSLEIQKEKDETSTLNAELTRLMGERDHMLMINSRFSTVSSLAMFNSAIVHELSQPLTALTVTLQEAQWHSKNDDPALQGALSDSLELVQKIGQMNHSLRNLMLAQKPGQETIDLGASIQDILPILHNETGRRAIGFTGPVAQPGLHIAANKVLIERILFNLVANAIDALSAQTASHNPLQNPPHIQLTLQRQERHNRPHAVVTVTDNGPGFAEHLLSQEWLHFQSTKDSGMGVGLVLARYIVSTWNGELLLCNRPQGGASIALWIPLTEAPTAEHSTPAAAKM